MLTLFIARYLHVLFSGIRNGLIYKGGKISKGGKYTKTYQILYVIMMVVIVLLSILQATKLQYWHIVPIWVSISLIAGCALLSVAATWLTIDIFGFIDDLHLWTAAESAMCFAMFCAFGHQGAIAAILCVYPSVIAQKIVINSMSGLPWNHEGTDDPTGQTYGIPTLGIKIPRQTFKTRFILAGISILLLFFALRYETNIALFIARFGL